MSDEVVLPVELDAGVLLVADVLLEPVAGRDGSDERPLSTECEPVALLLSDEVEPEDVVLEV